MLRSMIFGAALLIATQPANAACLLSDIAGTWNAQGVVKISAGRCRLVVAANGQVQQTNSVCSYLDSNNVRLSLRVGGSFTLESGFGCLFKAQLRTPGAKPFIAAIEAAMSKDKLVLAASGKVTYPADDFGASTYLLAATAIKQ